MGNESLAISRQEPAPRAPLHADNRTLHNPRMALSMHACFPPKHGAVHAGVFITHACRCACMQAPIPRTHGASKALKAGTSETTAVRGRFLLCMLRYLEIPPPPLSSAHASCSCTAWAAVQPNVPGSIDLPATLIPTLPTLGDSARVADSSCCPTALCRPARWTSAVQLPDL